MSLRKPVVHLEGRFNEFAVGKTVLNQHKQYDLDIQALRADFASGMVAMRNENERLNDKIIRLLDKFNDIELKVKDTQDEMFGHAEENKHACEVATYDVGELRMFLEQKFGLSSRKNVQTEWS
jgi:hypothetical protein